MKPPSPSTIRRGTAADLVALVDLHYRVFDEHTHLAMLFGREFLHAAYDWYTHAPNAFTLVAEADGRLHGSCTVNRGSYYAVFYRNMPVLAKTLIRHPALLIHPAIRKRLRALPQRRARNGRAQSCQSAYLAYLTVDPAGWGAGIGKQLVAAAVAECRRREWTEIVTAIHRDNLPARFMYRTLGFQDFPALTQGDLVGIRLHDAHLVTQA
jgi:GNAT superfamily N-acetyltransferase